MGLEGGSCPILPGPDAPPGGDPAALSEGWLHVEGTQLGASDWGLFMQKLEAHGIPPQSRRSGKGLLGPSWQDIGPRAGVWGSRAQHSGHRAGMPAGATARSALPDLSSCPRLVHSLGTSGTSGWTEGAPVQPCQTSAQTPGPERSPWEKRTAGVGGPAPWRCREPASFLTCGDVKPARGGSGRMGRGLQAWGRGHWSRRVAAPALSSWSSRWLLTG